MPKTLAYSAVDEGCKTRLSVSMAPNCAVPIFMDLREYLTGEVPANQRKTANYQVPVA
jgi:hypothetical protein